MVWNIKHIAKDLEESFALCKTELERQCWRAVVKHDCQRILAGRKPTPGELAILNKYGIHVE